jgi:HAD superfamily hydrolase (TIGR01549 family)
LKKEWLKYSQAKGIFFDLGHTLIEYGDNDWARIDFEGHRKGYNCLVVLGCRLPKFEIFHDRLMHLKETCRPAEREALQEWQATDAPEALLNELGVEKADEMSRKFVDVVYNDAQRYMSLADGSLETLRCLKNLGYHTGVISNTLYSSELLNADMKRFGLDPYLDTKIYSSTVGYRKPHPKIFQAAVDHSDLSPREIIYVGDRYRIDALGARQVGMLSILKLREDLSYPDPFPDDLPVIHHIPEIFKILKATPINNVT